MQGMNYRLDIKKGLLLMFNDWTIFSTQHSALSTSFPFISTAFKSNSFISSSHHVHLFCLFSVSEHDCVL